MNWDIEFQRAKTQAFAEWKARKEQNECPHDEHDHGICLDCGKDIMDDIVGAAEMARDAAEDR
jgi:Fe2+ or Zn2+ uptake regulation protein